MSRRVSENRLHLFDREPKVRCNFWFIDPGFPIFDNVIDWHTCSLQHWPPALYVSFAFNQRALGPIHGNPPLTLLFDQFQHVSPDVPTRLRATTLGLRL